MPQDNNLMSTNSNSYKSIMKGTAIFGGTQFFAILVNLIRGKLVALFLGPEGMGISSLMMSSMNTIQQFSSLGLNLSIVKEISKAKETGKEEKLLLVISIARALLRITAIIGPSGCGKSTLLKNILGYLHSSSGTIKIANKNSNEFSRTKKNRN